MGAYGAVPSRTTDEIDLEVLKAFAVTADRGRQVEVWEQVGAQGWAMTWAR